MLKVIEITVSMFLAALNSISIISQKCYIDILAITLNEMNNHMNDAIDNTISEKRFLEESNSGPRNKINCNIIGCLPYP